MSNADQSGILLEPIGVVSQRRHIKSHVNPELTYEITQVVRYYSTTDGVEDRMDMLVNVANETTDIWYLTAEALLSNNAQEYKRKYITGIHLPATSGAPHVTVFGTIFDSSGRTLSLTVTDAMSAYEAAQLAITGTLCWNNVSDFLNDGNDSNRWGAAPVRGTTIKSPAVSTVDGTPQKNASTKKSSVSTTKLLPNLDDAETMAAGTRISFPLTQVALTEKMLHLYSGKKYAYFYVDSADYPSISTKLKQYKTLPGVSGMLTPDVNLFATVELLDSKNGKRYYKFIDIARNE